MIFIIGGAGFVGSAFARVCQAQGREYRVIDKDNYQDFVGQSCDLLINANGNSVKFLAKQDPLADFDASVRSVRASLVDFQFKHYVMLSSCDVYPDCSSPEVTGEDSFIDISQQSGYGFHKYLAEQCVRQAVPRWQIVRLGGFVGPGLRKNPIFDILNGGLLWLDPESELQYIRTDKAAEIILSLAESGIYNQVFNLCGRGLVKLRDIMQAVGLGVPVQQGSPKVIYHVNINKIMSFAELPDSYETVLQFVREEMSQRE
jgi:nucleoside-diphosphate-sugar epimerase